MYLITLVARSVDLESKYDRQVNELNASQEQEIVQLKERHEDELQNLREKLDMVKFHDITKYFVLSTSETSYLKM